MAIKCFAAQREDAVSALARRRRDSDTSQIPVTKPTTKKNSFCTPTHKHTQTHTRARARAHTHRHTQNPALPAPPPSHQPTLANTARSREISVARVRVALEVLTVDEALDPLLQVGRLERELGQGQGKGQGQG